MFTPPSQKPKKRTNDINKEVQIIAGRVRARNTQPAKAAFRIIVLNVRMIPKNVPYGYTFILPEFKKAMLGLKPVKLPDEIHSLENRPSAIHHEVVSRHVTREIAR